MQWFGRGRRGGGRDCGPKEVVEGLRVQEALEEAAAEPRDVGSVLQLCAAGEVKSGGRNRGTGGSEARGAQPVGGCQPGCPGTGRAWAWKSRTEGSWTRSSRVRGPGLWAQFWQQPRQVVHQVPLFLDLPHQLLPQPLDGSGIRPGLGDANRQDDAEQNEEWEAEGVGAEVTEGTLARKWELEGYQLGYHLPGGRIVCEEATVPGGVGAADHVGQRYCSQKQA